MESLATNLTARGDFRLMNEEIVVAVVVMQFKIIMKYCFPLDLLVCSTLFMVSLDSYPIYMVFVWYHARLRARFPLYTSRQQPKRIAGYEI